jgi:DNA-binding NarL/FixJ family response regulator
MPSSITLVIIHPWELLRLGLLSVFKGEAGIRVVAHGSTGKDAGGLIKQHRPDVLLLYDQLDDQDSFDLAKQLKESNPELKIVMLGVQENSTYMARAASARADDYLFEGSTGRQIIDTIKNAANGKPPSPSSGYGKVLASMRDRSSNPTLDLTPRELQVLRHIGYGLSNEEIARSMGISVETIKEHVQNILRKMGVQDRTQAAVWVVKQGLV